MICRMELDRDNDSGGWRLTTLHMASPSALKIKSTDPFWLSSLSSAAIQPLVMARAAVFAPCSALASPPSALPVPATVAFHRRRRALVAAAAQLDKNGFGGGAGHDGRKKLGMASSNYVVPLDKQMPGLVRPLAEILRDLNSRVSEKMINPENNSIPWYVVALDSQVYHVFPCLIND